MNNMNKYFRSTTNRYSELADFIDKSPVKELGIFFPKLISEIFSPNNKVNWGLRTLQIDANLTDIHEILNFLQPNGPLFRLCYKLLLDCHRYEYPYQFLPEVVRRRLEDTGDTSLYRQKIVARPNISGNNISLNAFEYYMFHFAYHLIDPTVQLGVADENVSSWDSVYLRLVELYLDHFVPVTSCVVNPPLNHSTNTLSTTQQALNSYSPPSKSSSLIFREEVWKKMSPSPPLIVRTKSNSSAEIWRSELVATLFLDFWLSCKSDNSNTKSFSGQKLWSIECLPSKEQLRCIRLLLKHLHYFCNHLLNKDCAMNDLKRELLSNNRRTIYEFFYSTMTQLPVDSSYRILLEGWFTYIQPWRYTEAYPYVMVKPNSKERDKKLWFQFIAENLVVYTRLYYVVLARLLRCDLTTFKISSMTYRLAQVFSQPHLLDQITEVEKSLDDSRLGSISSWNSVIRQNIYCLEKATYHYDFFQSPVHLQQVMEFIKQIEENLPVLQLRKQRLQSSGNASFFEWMKEQLTSDLQYSAIQELEKIEFHLTQSLEKLYHLHDIPKDSLRGNSPIFNGSGNSTSSHLNISSDYDSIDGLVLSNSSLTIDPKVRRKMALSFSYEGDPDLYPIRSWENKFLVRLFFYICLWINTQFQRDLKRLYYENNIIGGIFRQVMCPPKRTFYYEKRTPPDGYSRRVSAILPPRISLRWCASYYFIISCLSFCAILKFFQYSVSNFFVVMIFFYFLYLIMNSILTPVPAEESEQEFLSR